MKKILYLSLSAMLVFSTLCLSGCGDSEDDNNVTTTTEAVTTTSVDEETTAEPEDEGKVTYTIKVVDESGAAISGAMVQLCKDSCVPGVTDENGVAEFKLVEADYKASLMMMPDGYAYSGTEEEFYYEDGTTELTITLKAQ